MEGLRQHFNFFLLRRDCTIAKFGKRVVGGGKVYSKNLILYDYRISICFVEKFLLYFITISLSTSKTFVSPGKKVLSVFARVSFDSLFFFTISFLTPKTIFFLWWMGGGGWCPTFWFLKYLDDNMVFTLDIDVYVFI